MTDYFYTYIIQEIFLSLPAELGPSTNNPYLLSMQKLLLPLLASLTLYSVSRLGALQHPRQTALVYALRGEQRDER